MKELSLLHIEHWQNFLLAFIPLFIAIDVLGVLPIFMSLIEGIEKPQKTKIIRQSVITALTVSIGFLAIGKFVFSVLGIEIYDFKIAGGLLLLVFAINDLLFAEKGKRTITSTMGVVPLDRGLDPILVSAHVITQVKSLIPQEIDARQPLVLTFGRIEGGNRFNMLADKVTLEGSLRYLEPSIREKALTSLKRHLTGLARATGAKIDLKHTAIYPILQNHPGLAERAVAVRQQALGQRRVRSHLPAMGSEDFAYFAQKAPAFYFFLGVRTPGTKGHALHSPDFNPTKQPSLSASKPRPASWRPLAR